MTDLFEDRPAESGEGLPAIPAIDQADGNARALLAGSSTLPTTDSRDALGTRESLCSSTDGTTASPLADNLESGRLGKLVGANAEANEGWGWGHSHHRRQHPTAKRLHFTPKSRE